MQKIYKSPNFPTSSNTMQLSSTRLLLPAVAPTLPQTTRPNYYTLCLGDTLPTLVPITISKPTDLRLDPGSSTLAPLTQLRPASPMLRGLSSLSQALLRASSVSSATSRSPIMADAPLASPELPETRKKRPKKEDRAKKYECKTCYKCFTTLGHLARHMRIHTGERKHVCPYPDCESRFARQDNCMQHYRTHLNTGKRKRRAKVE